LRMMTMPQNNSIAISDQVVMLPHPCGMAATVGLLCVW
jgi:hypothetical protein